MCALRRLQRKPKTLNAQQITRLTISPTIALFSFSFSRFTPVDFANSLLKGIPHFLELGPKYFVNNSLFFPGLVTAAITRNERCHQFYAIFFLFQTAIISFAIFHTLS